MMKILNVAAALALALPAVTPTQSVAQSPRPHGGPPAAAAAGPRAGGAQFGGPRMGAAGPQFAAGARFNGAGPGFNGAGPRFSGAGPRFHGDGDHDGFRHHHNWGFVGGVAAGAAIGGALAAPYYAGDPYYANDYYDDYGAGAVTGVVPAGGGDDVAYCMQSYSSYDPASGTYLGYDGLRYPCP